MSGAETELRAMVRDDTDIKALEEDDWMALGVRLPCGRKYGVESMFDGRDPGSVREALAVKLLACVRKANAA